MRNSTRYKAASHLSIEGTLPATLPFENENKVLDDLRSGALFSISTLYESYELPEFTICHASIPHTKGDKIKPNNMIADTSRLYFGKYSQHIINDGKMHSLCQNMIKITIKLTQIRTQFHMHTEIQI